MNVRMHRPTTAMRLRIKRLATMAPGDRTFTRRSSLREYCSAWGAALFLFSMFSFTAFLPLSQARRTRGSTTAYRMSEIRLPISVRMEMNAR